MVSLLGLPQIQQLRENSKAFSQSHGNLIKFYLIQFDLIYTSNYFGRKADSKKKKRDLDHLNL